jgi:hypothetical protein
MQQFIRAPLPCIFPTMMVHAKIIAIMKIGKSHQTVSLKKAQGNIRITPSRPYRRKGGEKGYSYFAGQFREKGRRSHASSLRSSRNKKHICSISLRSFVRVWIPAFAGMTRHEVLFPVFLATTFYFLLGQFMTGHRAQFSSSSFSMPKGIVSPHRQTQPSVVFARSSSSQKGQASIFFSSLPFMIPRIRTVGYDPSHKTGSCPEPLRD